MGKENFLSPRIPIATYRLQFNRYFKFSHARTLVPYLFGSNIFNILILAVDDIFFTRGPLLYFSNPDYIISALSAMAMTAIAIVGLTYRAEKKIILA